MSSSISFFNEEINFTLKNKKKISEWIVTIVEQHKYNIQNINYIFCNDKYLHQINLKHLQHDTYTDIITFDYTNKKSKELIADIYISTERVKENSQAFKTTFQKELNRVIIHGILHLLGYSDKTNKQQKQMRKKEDAYLILLQSIF